MHNEPALPLVAEDETGASARVLIASEQGDMRALLAHLLTAAGFEVSKVRDGDEALERIGDQLSQSPPRRFDLVVVDVRQREAPGLDLFLRLGHGSWRPPVVLIVPSDDTMLRARMADLGAAALLEWPFAVDELHAATAMARPNRAAR